MEKLNEFSARLIQTADLLKSKYEELVKQVTDGRICSFENCISECLYNLNLRCRRLR